MQRVISKAKSRSITPKKSGVVNPVRSKMKRGAGPVASSSTSTVQALEDRSATPALPSTSNILKGLIAPARTPAQQISDADEPRYTVTEMTDDTNLTPTVYTIQEQFNTTSSSIEPISLGIGEPKELDPAKLLHRLRDATDEHSGNSLGGSDYGHSSQVQNEIDAELEGKTDY